MTPTSNSFPVAAPAVVVIDGSPPPQPTPPLPTSQLQPHSQLLSTSPVAEGGRALSSTSTSIPTGGHDTDNNNTTNGPEKARHHQQDDGTTSNDRTGTAGPSQVPTLTITTKSHTKSPASQHADLALNVLSSTKQHEIPKNVPDKQTPTTVAKSEPNNIRRPSPKAPTTRLNAHQIFYIFILDGLGAMILSSAINFAIAYAMYTSGPGSAPAANGGNTNQVASPPPPILLFHLPNSLAGDAAVTIILQTVITWLVECLLVNRDLERGGVRPVGFVQIPRRKFVRWFCFLGQEEFEEDEDRSGTSSNVKESGNLTKEIIAGKEKKEAERDLEEEVNVTAASNWGWMSFLRSQIVRALLVAAVMFLLLWGPCVGILMALGRRDETIGGLGDWVFERRVWLPQVFKLILGGLLALLETPAFAFFWMAQAGWAFHRASSTGADVGTGTGSGIVSARKSVVEEEV